MVAMMLLFLSLVGAHCDGASERPATGPALQLNRESKRESCLFYSLSPSRLTPPLASERLAGPGVWSKTGLWGDWSGGRPGRPQNRDVAHSIYSPFLIYSPMLYSLFYSLSTSTSSLPCVVTCVIVTPMYSLPCVFDDGCQGHPVFFYQRRIVFICCRRLFPSCLTSSIVS